MFTEDEFASLLALRKANFNPYQPRDDHGCWSDASCLGDIHPSTVAYNGRFYDIVVDDFLNGLTEDGSTVLRNVWIVGVMA